MMDLKSANIERIGATIDGKIPIRMYRYEGQIGCSVSTACDIVVPLGLQNYYKKNTPKKIEETKEKSAGVGSTLHELADKAIKEEKVEPKPEFKKWVEDNHETVAKYKMVAEASEIKLFSKVFAVGGQVDYIGTFDCDCPQCSKNLPKSKRAIVDRKTGRYNVINLWKTSMYRQMYVELTGDQDIGTVILHQPRPDLIEKGVKGTHYSIGRHETCVLSFLSAYQDFKMYYYRDLIKAGMRESDVYQLSPFVYYEYLYGRGIHKEADEMLNGLAREQRK